MKLITDLGKQLVTNSPILRLVCKAGRLMGILCIVVVLPYVTASKRNSTAVLQLAHYTLI